MIIAALILSIISLILSIASIVWLLAKQLSTHQVSMVPIDPFKDSFPKEIGKEQLDDFRDLGEPIDQEEFEYLNKRKSSV
jgi:hypothetical protein